MAKASSKEKAEEIMGKEVTIRAIWHSYHTIEVPDDWTVPNTLDGFPDDALEEITSDTASLVDWD